MPKKKKQQQRVRRRAARTVLLFALVSLVLLLGHMYAAAHIIHLKQETVTLRDLPKMFDGTKILFISDIDVMNGVDAWGVKGVFKKIETSGADMLILGGDYSTNSLLNGLNGRDKAAAEAKAAEAIRVLSYYNAPLGKYAVGGEEDAESEEIKAALRDAGFTLLGDTSALVTLGGAQIRITGLAAGSAMTNRDAVARNISSSECTIVVAHDPAAYAGVRVAEARDGGDWADLVLSGHTLGGQIVVAGHGIREATTDDLRAGWYNTRDVPHLISSGLGCRDVPLRLGTKSEMHLIELKSKE